MRDEVAEEEEPPPEEPPPDEPLPPRIPRTVRIQHDLDSAEELLSAGFRRIRGGESEFNGGILRLVSRNFEEWSADRNLRIPWWSEVGNASVWAVETRMRIDPASPEATCPDGGPGLWIHDGNIGLKIPLRTIRGAADGRFHVFRVEHRDGQTSVSMDGEPVEARVREGPVTRSLMFGDLGCGPSVSEWDWFAYEVQVFDSDEPRSRRPGDWHKGTDVRELLAAIAGELGPPRAERLMALRLSSDAGWCVATLAVDAAARQGVALGFEHAGDSAHATQLRALSPLLTPSERARASSALRTITTPRALPGCDPVRPGDCQRPPPLPLTPRPPGLPSLQASLARSRDWSTHPAHAIESTRLAARALTEAGRVPGVSAAADALVARIEALAHAVPPDCGL